MAVSGEILRYIGNEIVNTSGKELAKNSISSALSSIVPKSVSSALPSIASKTSSDLLSKLSSGMVAYHGSPTTGIKNFDINMAGKNTLSGERAIYFTDDYPTAEDFSYERSPSNSMVVDKRGKKGQVYTRKITMKNPLDLDNLTDDQIASLYDYADPRSASIMDRGKFIQTLQDARNAGNGQMIKAQLDLNRLPEAGYDGFIAKMYPGENDIREYGLFDANSISEVPQNVRDRVSQYIPQVNDRIVDEYGNPKTFYHSTPYEFDKFDDNKLGQNTQYTNTALGHFITDDEDFSKRFIDVNNIGKTGRTMELQARVKNPIIHPYYAHMKYPAEQLDDILINWVKATSGDEKTAQTIIDSYKDAANTRKEQMNSIGEVYDTKSPLWDEYMQSVFEDNDPFEYSVDDRASLLKNGYDAVEIVEGLKNELVDGSTDTKPISSYAILNGDNLRRVKHLPIEKTTTTEDVPVSTLRTLFRGQKKGSDDLYYNKGDGTTGSLTVGNGYYMTPNAEKANIWAGEGITPIRVQANTKDILSRNELIEKTNWANSLINDIDYMAKLWEEDPEMASFIENLSIGRLPEVSKYLDKPFIQPDSGQGEELAETIFFPDTRPELTKEIRASLKGNSPNSVQSSSGQVDLSSLDNPLFKEFGSDYDIDLFKRAKSGDILTAEEIENSLFRQALEKKADDAEALYGEEIITKDMSDGTYPIPVDVASRMNVIADEVLSKANQNPNIAHNRQAIIFMGGPSSGKSSAGMKLYDAEKGGDYFVLDSDDVKPMFEEFGNGEGAGITHEASVYVTNSIVKPALMAEGTNLAIPVVGKTEKSLYRNIQELVDAGYNVSVVLTELPVEKAASRNFTRMLETGRNVADEYVRHIVGDKPLGVYKKLVSDINNGLVEGVSGYARVNNDVPFGSSPILVDYSGDSDILRPLIEKLGEIQ